MTITIPERDRSQMICTLYYTEQIYKYEKFEMSIYLLFHT